MSLKTKHLHIIELSFKYLTETEKNYGQVNLLKKLDYLGHGVAPATLSKISQGKHVGKASLEKVAKGFELILEKELCLRYDESNRRFELIPDGIPSIISETDTIAKPSGRDAVSWLKSYPSGRLSVPLKAEFISSARQEVIELGLRLNSFAGYFTHRNADEYKKHIIRLLQKGVHINCYIADPIAPTTKLYFEDRAKINAKELKKYREIPEIIEDLKDLIRDFKSEDYTGKMQLHSYNSLPYFHALVVDGDSKHGKMLVSHYMYGISRADTPVIEISKAEHPDLFDKYWIAIGHIISNSTLIFPS